MPEMPTTTRLVFFNPASGSAWIGRRTRRAAEALLRVPGTEAFETRRGDVAAQVRGMLAPAITRVYAIGGDGTVGDVATALVGTNAALGIIPCGTTNVLAREYGISLWTQRAVRDLEASDRTSLLRTWTLGGHTVVLGAGVGWDGRVMWKSSQAMKQRLGRAGIAALGLREIATYDFPPLVVTGTDENGHQIMLRGSQVILATVKRWAGGNIGIPQADPSDEFIDLVVLETQSRFGMWLFWTLMTLPGGKPLSLKGVRTARVRDAKVWCEDGRAIEAHVNGEPVVKSPIALLPSGTVRILVP
jgi:diacylglycerol kinase (ATP)